jgi:teichuronic acid biosynthesis glycosyltransferase TuaG
MSAPKISVIMPAFNSSRYIREAVDSVSAQSEPDFELLIVDGGSKDRTVDIIREYAQRDPRIRYVPNPDDKGPAHARATGVRASQGRFIAFLDADDVWLPTKLTEQVGYMEEQGVDFSYTYYSGMSADGSMVMCPHSAYASYSFWKMMASRGIGTLTVVIRRELLSEDVLAHQKKSHGEELLWWLLILRKGHVARLYPKDLARYRDTEGSLSTFRWRHQSTVWDTYRNEMGMNPVLSGVLYASYMTDVAIRRLRTLVCTRMRRA